MKKTTYTAKNDLQLLDLDIVDYELFSHFCNLVFGCFLMTKLQKYYIIFLTGKNGTHANKNLATYFWYFDSFDEKQTYENM